MNNNISSVEKKSGGKESQVTNVVEAPITISSPNP